MMMTLPAKFVKDEEQKQNLFTVKLSVYVDISKLILLKKKNESHAYLLITLIASVIHVNDKTLIVFIACGSVERNSFYQRYLALVCFIDKKFLISNIIKNQ